MSAPLSRQKLDSMIATALAEYDDDVRAEWLRIRIEPEKWRCSPWGDESGGFWVVAVDGDRALWFNDIEGGLNWSRYTTLGTIDEYLCSEFTEYTKLAEFFEGIAREQSEVTRARVPEGALSANVSGPGTIVFRQSTYWDVRADSGGTCRIHFRYKGEFAFTTAAYPSIELTDRHPLLAQYDEPQRSLYFFGAPHNPSAAAENLERAIRDMSQSWRALRDYAGSTEAVEQRLRAGHGMLMQGNRTEIDPVAAIGLERSCGPTWHTEGSGPSTKHAAS